MGFFNDLFGDREGKKAKLEVARLHKGWTEDVATLAKLKAAFIHVNDGIERVMKEIAGLEERIPTEEPKLKSI